MMDKTKFLTGRLERRKGSAVGFADKLSCRRIAPFFSDKINFASQNLSFPRRGPPPSPKFQATACVIFARKMDVRHLFFPSFMSFSCFLGGLSSRAWFALDAFCRLFPGHFSLCVFFFSPLSFFLVFVCFSPACAVDRFPSTWRLGGPNAPFIVSLPLPLRLLRISRRSEPKLMRQQTARLTARLAALTLLCFAQNHEICLFPCAYNTNCLVRHARQNRNSNHDVKNRPNFSVWA